jgi:hypothetical protein
MNIEYRKLKKLGSYPNNSEYIFDFEKCKICNKSLLVDELVGYIICDNDNVYYKILSYKVRCCTYDSDFPHRNICKGLSHLKDF